MQTFKAPTLQDHINSAKKMHFCARCLTARDCHDEKQNTAVIGRHEWEPGMEIALAEALEKSNRTIESIKILFGEGIIPYPLRDLLRTILADDFDA